MIVYTDADKADNDDEPHAPQDVTADRPTIMDDPATIDMAQ